MNHNPIPIKWRGMRLVLALFFISGFLQPALQPVQANFAPENTTKITINGPAGSGSFGATVTALPNGNFVVTDPKYSEGGKANIGAVYLYNGSTRALISVMKGEHAGDQVGLDDVSVLPDGNFLVTSTQWANGAASQAGAVTWCSGTTGCPSSISPTNSLVGGRSGDQVGYYDFFSSGVIRFENGDYSVRSRYWNSATAVNVGAFTLCRQAGGCTGVVSPDNSLVGTKQDDLLTMYLCLDHAGTYVLVCDKWDNGSVANAGAVTYCGSASGCQGVISVTNSLVGNQTGDLSGADISLLANGSYLVRSPYYDDGTLVDAGAVTFCSGASGCTGRIGYATTSLIGQQANDRVGSGRIVFDHQGNYAVYSPNWSNGSQAKAGAVTWCSYLHPCIGWITAANSLIGSTANDQVGYCRDWDYSESRAFYLITSPYWDNGAVVNAGAVTWCNLQSGCRGEVSSANSLVGSSANDGSGMELTRPFIDDYYIVNAPGWDNGATSNVGAVTWCPIAGGCTGVIQAANSLIGSQADDRVGMHTAILGRGKYLISSPDWDYGTVVNAGAITICTQAGGCPGTVGLGNSLIGGSTGANIGQASYSINEEATIIVFAHYGWRNGSLENLGAVTYCELLAPCTGIVSADNSLVGAQAGDRVGHSGAQVLPNGDYVVASPEWKAGDIAAVGAVTWCSKSAGGCKGIISAANSLVGSQTNDQVGTWGYFILENGNIVVSSPYWNNGSQAEAGALTFCSSASDCRGTVSAANSLVGTSAGDRIGYEMDLLENGDYIFFSYSYDSATIINAGLLGWCTMTTGCRGEAGEQAYAVIGEAADGGEWMRYTYDGTHKRMIVGRSKENKVTLLSLLLDATMQVASSRNPAPLAAPVTFSVTLSGSSGTPTGTVKFQVDGGPAVTRTLVNGSASYTPTWLSAGTHTLTVTYSGNSVYASRSASLTPAQVIWPAVFLPMLVR